MMPGRLGVCVVIGSAALGGLLTALGNQEPGAILGICIVAGTIIASLAVRPRAGYLILPVPALAYLVTAGIAGLIHDRATDTSNTAVAANAIQWIAGGFVAMSAATVVVIVITAARWRRKSRFDSFQDPDEY
jgi:4-amino-4-deoxy-L-arabinose transferase-like glycosyltransferase